MAERPLLLFPSKAKVSFQKKQGGPEQEFIKPTKLIQMGRIDTMFKKVNKAFDERRIEVDASADGLAPELVLVFETRGTIQDFFKAVSKIPELKWLGEYEDDFEPTNEFNYATDTTKPVSGKLYFFLANTSALRELRSLWNTWKSKKQKFKSGETKWKHLFNLLYDIRLWGVKDRIEETGILADLEYRIAHNQEIIPFEVELWFRKSSGQRRINKDRISTLLNQDSGQIINECVIEEIGYHALLVQAPIKIFHNLNEQTAISFFKSSDIMSIRPVGQGILMTEGLLDEEIADGQIENQQKFDQPVIALLDGLPIQNHLYLADRITIHDPENFEEDYPTNARIHGTGMASIILHGDLADNNIPLKSKLLIRPVMRHRLLPGGGAEEFIPENYLVVDLIHRVVKEIIEGGNGIGAVAPTVKVINLSLGDRFRIFDHYISPWAKLIDWLSEKYNILFIVSAGNVNDNVSFDIQDMAFTEILENPDNLLNKSINYFFRKNRFRKVLSPGEAINALTVGSLHADVNTEIQLNDRINLYENPELPSPISRMGMGFRRSIKPEILAKGGRTLYRRNGNNELRLVDYYARPPGIKVASPSHDGAPNGIRYSKGTSNAAAIVTHTVGKIYENLFDDDLLRQSLTTDYFSVVAKGLIVHSASWNQDIYNFFINTIETNSNKRDLVSRFVGYGKIDGERILECTDKRVTLIGYGSLRPEEAFQYELPLPDALSGTTRWKKLVATLAWFSPINCENQLYRTHKLWFEFPNNDIDAKLKASRAFYDNDTVRRGTVQHEIFFGNKATAFPDNSNLSIKVNCKADALKYDAITFKANKSIKGIKYALIVTLEIDPELQIDVYNDINLRIKQRLRPAQ